MIKPSSPGPATQRKVRRPDIGQFPAVLQGPWGRWIDPGWTKCCASPARGLVAELPRGREHSLRDNSPAVP